MKKLTRTIMQMLRAAARAAVAEWQLGASPAAHDSLVRDNPKSR